MLQQHGGMPVSGAGPDPSLTNNLNSTQNNNLNPLAMGNSYDPTYNNNVPQDLWRMPMTLEWDWADMTGFMGGMGGGGFEDGISMNGVLPDFSQGAGGTSGMNMGGMGGQG